MNILYANFIIGIGLSFSWKFNLNHTKESGKHNLKFGQIDYVLVWSEIRQINSQQDQITSMFSVW